VRACSAFWLFCYFGYYRRTHCKKGSHGFAKGYQIAYKTGGRTLVSQGQHFQVVKKDWLMNSVMIRS
jgi:hypothetical protein